MPDPSTDREPELLTITEAADILRPPSPPSAIGDTSARVRAASALAAASSTATRTARLDRRPTR